MDVSAYPHIAALMTLKKPAVCITLTPQLAEVLNTLIDRLIIHHHTKEYWPELTHANLQSEFHQLVEHAMHFKLITFDEANTLMRALYPETTYADLVRPTWNDFKISEGQAVILNAAKIALDATEPGTWLPNQPCVPTLLEKAEELNLFFDPATLAMMRAALTYPNNGLPVVLEFKD